MVGEALHEPAHITSLAANRMLRVVGVWTVDLELVRPFDERGRHELAEPYSTADRAGVRIEVRFGPDLTLEQGPINAILLRVKLNQAVIAVSEVHLWRWYWDR